MLADSAKAVPDVILLASGSEVELALGAKDKPRRRGHRRRAWSPCPALRSLTSRTRPTARVVLPKAVRARLAIEAATSFGWHKYVGLDGDVLSLDHFGASAPANLLFERFGFTADNAAQKAKALLQK